MREQLASMCAADGNRVAVTILMMSPLDDLYAKKNMPAPKVSAGMPIRLTLVRATSLVTAR